ncbi:S10 family peptidase [Acidobacteriota bacterium]
MDTPGKESFRIASLPGLTEQPSFRQYSGYITVNERYNGRLFFWFVESEGSPESDPLIVWINGGPGASSMDGFFIEHGPFHINDNLSLSANPWSWNRFANILYLDQPVGTGLSYTDPGGYATNDDEVDKEFYIFLERFLGEFEEYSNHELFLAGESFGGHYIIRMADYILKRQGRMKAVPMRLEGLMIGNGLFDPPPQIMSGIDVAHAHGLIDYKQKLALEKKYSGLELAKLQDSEDDVWDPVLVDIMGMTVWNDWCVNPYDIRQFITSGYLSQQEELIKRYLAQDEVKKAIHSESDPDEWQDFNPRVYEHLRKCIDEPVVMNLPNLLTRQRVLFYNGQYDIICNPLGTEASLYKLKWSGQRGFREAGRQVWGFDGKPAGFWKSFGNLSFLILLGAGHMAPVDVPAETQTLMKQFTRNIQPAD